MYEDVKVLVEAVASSGEKNLLFFCPGCNYYHSFRIENGRDGVLPVWKWNGNRQKPTFSPSLLVNGTTDKRCHLYLVDGQIRYLSDCWHNLSGQVIALPEIEW